MCMIVAAIWVVTATFCQANLAVSYAVAVAGLLQLLIQLPQLHSHQLLVMPKVSFRHPGVRRILKLMLPALFKGIGHPNQYAGQHGAGFNHG
ncbi:MAG: lipid II flippase MurJ [Moraxella osloensis]